MHKWLCFLLFFLPFKGIVAQQHFLTFGVDYANFSWKWLDNRPNNNSKNSWLNTVGFFKETQGVFGWQLSVQAGKINNLGKSADFHQSSNWFKFNADILVNFLKIFSSNKTRVIPSWLVGYGINYIPGHSETGLNKVGVNLNTGLHLRYKTNNKLLLTFYNGLGQRLGYDFRTSYFSGIGVGIKM